MTAATTGKRNNSRALVCACSSTARPVEAAAPSKRRRLTFATRTVNVENDDITREVTMPAAVAAASCCCTPHQFVMDTLKSRGFAVTTSDALTQSGSFFANYTEEEIKAYSHDVLTAVRSRDMATLREFHSAGRPLKCSNRFGESLLHLACRKGFTDVVSFFIKDANVSVQVIDDYGRTPLHDACWTCEPNFELLELLLTACPDLMFMRDRRGHYALEYARKEHYGAYVKFLSSFLAKITTL